MTEDPARYEWITRGAVYAPGQPGHYDVLLNKMAREGWHLIQAVARDDRAITFLFRRELMGDAAPGE